MSKVHPSHSTKVTDASTYDEICDNCGATDGGVALSRPCPFQTTRAGGAKTVQITITEALAELKLIDAKVGKKQEFIGSYLVRQNCLMDPLGDSGGSRKVLEQEQQAVKDLLERKVTIRRAIQAANADTVVTIEGETRSLADWLVWRREVAPTEQKFLRDIQAKVNQARNNAHNSRLAMVPAEKEPTAPTDVVVNISERKLGQRAEQVESILAKLDGQLSLKNATVCVAI